MKLRVAIVLVASVFAVRAHATEPVVTEAVIDAPVAVVWEAFTTKGGMESWMAASADIQLAVGGRWRTSHQKNADLDGDTAIHQEILSLDPQRMFSFRTVKSPKNFPFAGTIGDTWTVIYFEALTADRTKVTVRMLGYTDTPDAQKMRAFFEFGNKATLDALMKRFASAGGATR